MPSPGNFVLGLSTAAEDERGIILPVCAIAVSRLALEILKIHSPLAAVLADAEDVAVAAGGVEGAAC